MPSVRTRMTLEEFLALPERKPALEYEDGVVMQKVFPKGRHSALQSGISEQINRQIRPRRLGRAFPELRTTFANMSRVPAVALYRWSRIPRDAAGIVVDDFLDWPDIAIEIISPGQTRAALIRRLCSFVRAGVRVAVLADPARQSITLVRSDAELVELRPGDVLDLSDVIPDLRLDVRAVFDELRN